MSPVVQRIRRYPVKSMGGEDLEHAEVAARGIAGDRWYAVVDGDGKLASGKHGSRFRRRDEVFDFRATTRNGEVTITGDDGRWSVDDPDLSRALSTVMGAPVEVRAEQQTPHFDAGQVSLVGTATLDWCARRWDIEADARRLRVNLVVATDEPFVEDTWVGRTVRVGSTVLTGHKRITRCRMIDIDQDGARAEGRWLGHLAEERDTCVAIYLYVTTPGTINVGDDVTIT